MKLIVASENPKMLKFTTLQFGKKLFKLFKSLSLSVVLRFSFVQPENSLKILFYIPIWYPEIAILIKKVKTSRYAQILFFEKKYPKKHIIIERIYGILWYKHNLQAGIDKTCSIYKANIIVKELTSKIVG